MRLSTKRRLLHPFKWRQLLYFKRYRLQCKWVSGTAFFIQTHNSFQIPLLQERDCNSQQVQAADWRAYSQLVQTASVLVTNQNFICAHIHREENCRANNLANLARRMQMSYTGFTYPLFLEDGCSNFS